MTIQLNRPRTLQEIAHEHGLPFRAIAVRSGEMSNGVLPRPVGAMYTFVSAVGGGVSYVGNGSEGVVRVSGDIARWAVVESLSGDDPGSVADSQPEDGASDSSEDQA